MPYLGLALPNDRLHPPAPSPLVLCDRLISLAQDAERAGFAITAERLVHLACGMFDEDGIHPMS